MLIDPYPAKNRPKVRRTGIGVVRAKIGGNIQKRMEIPQPGLIRTDLSNVTFGLIV